MCDKCKNLLNLPNDKKAWTHLFNYKEDELNDANHFKMIMEVNHDEETKKPYAFIATDIEIKSTGLTYGNSIDIKYCPFCGQKLYEE